jgi:hypothetical protein
MISVADMMSHIAVQINSPLDRFLEAKVRTAVLAGWSRLMSMHEWGYFHRLGTLITFAGQRTGTVDFDYDTRQVTLTDATWPTDAVAQHIRLDQNWYPIYRRISDTVIELYSGKHPDDDLADVEYLIQQVMYPLPSDVSDVVQVLEGTQNMQLQRLNLLEAFQIQEGFAWSPALPTTYALVADTANPQRWCMWIPTEQTQRTSLQYMYVMRRPSNVLVTEARGTVTVSGGVATFSESVVSSLWNGALLRVGTDDYTQPTGDFGDVPGVDVLFNRDCTEVRVLEVLTATTCRISNTTLTATNVAYVASSHIDVCDGAMETLLMRLCEDEYGVRLVGNHSERMVSANRLASAFNDAKASDGRHVRNKGSERHWYGLRLRDVGRVTNES